MGSTAKTTKRKTVIKMWFPRHFEANLTNHIVIIKQPWPSGTYKLI